MCSMGSMAVAVLQGDSLLSVQFCRAVHLRLHPAPQISSAPFRPFLCTPAGCVQSPSMCPALSLLNPQPYRVIRCGEHHDTRS